MSRKPLDLTDVRRGKLVARRRCDPPASAGGLDCWWTCDCDCGATGHMVRSGQFNAGKINSCGCGKSSNKAIEALLNKSLLDDPPCPPGTFPYLLCRARQARGETGGRFAAAIGIHPATFGNIQCGRFGPTLAVLVRMGDVLGWSPEKLGEMARLAAAYPWTTRDEIGTPRTPNYRSAKKRFQAVA